MHYMRSLNLPNVLFLGRFYPQQLLRSIKSDSKGNVGFSNHNFEMSILYGLEQQAVNFQVLSVPEVYSWPHNNKKIFTKAERYKDCRARIKSAGFINILILNRLSVFVSVLFNLLDLYKKFDGPSIHVITNAPNLFILMALRCSKLFTNKKIDVTVIIPDIPSMISQIHSRKGIKRKAIALLDNYSLYLLSRCERHVLLTEAMTDFFKTPVRHIVMEGLIDERNYIELPQFNKYVKQVILYTGSIHRQFGIMNLVDAFEKASLPDDVELWICGSGDAEDELKHRANGNKNIRYWGLVDSDKARELQQSATILVNPRTSGLSFTKYSFPSKTLEYMMTGRPVVMNKLPGIPEVYFNYVITPKDESIEQWAITLTDVMINKYEYYRNRGVLGREFVLNNKNAPKQMKRVIDFITEDSNE